MKNIFKNLFTRKPVPTYPEYKEIKESIDGTPEEDIKEKLSAFGLSRKSEERDEYEMSTKPSTDIEKLLADVPFGNTSSDIAYTVANKDYEFLIMVHYGQCVCSVFFIDRTTNALRKL